MEILVTGGAGFIGSHLIAYHLAQHDVVYAIDDYSTGTRQTIAHFTPHANFHFIEGDLLTHPSLEAIVCSVDRIYHMAAVVGVFKVMFDSKRLLETNILATERLLRLATHSKRDPRILLASSSEVYGEGEGHPFSEGDPLIVGARRKGCAAYVVSKMALECFGSSFHQHENLKTTSLRLFNTIGPRQLGGYGMVVPRFIDQAVANQPLVVYGTGEQTRSFCDVRDVVKMMDCIAGSVETIGQVLNVGHDQEISMNQLALRIKRLANSASEIQHLPYEKIYGPGFEDAMYRRPDLSALQRLIAYQYDWDLTKTLHDLIHSHP